MIEEVQVIHPYGQRYLNNHCILCLHNCMVKNNNNMTLFMIQVFDKGMCAKTFSSELLTSHPASNEVVLVGFSL